MLNHLQILIHPVIFLVKGEVHQFEAVGEFEHGVVGDGAAALAVEAGSLEKLFDFLVVAALANSLRTNARSVRCIKNAE